MMEFMKTVEARKSYRGEFTSRPVPRQDLEDMLKAGVLAPSGCNLQTTEFIGVDDPALVKRLAEISGYGWALTSTAAILLLTKETMSYSGVSYHIHDYCAAAENIWLAATDKGYSTVWVEGHIRGEKARQMGDLLNVPEDMAVAVYFPLGVPAKEIPKAVKKSFGERAWFNGYFQSSPEKKCQV